MAARRPLPPTAREEHDMATTTPSGPRGSSPLGHLPPAESTRLLDFDRVEIRTLRSFPPQFVLVVHGTKPFVNMEVELVPLVFIQQPEYWGIEVVGRLRGIGLPVVAPYTASLHLAGVMGTKGIEVIGATRTERIDLPPQAEPTPGLALELQGDGAAITYAEDVSGGPLSLTCSGPAAELSFTGEEIRVVPSELGRQATVSLEGAPDAPTVKLTLLLPTIRLGASGEADVRTVAIRSTDLDTAFTAGPREGQRMTYETLALTGTARMGAPTPVPGSEIGCRCFRAGSFRHAEGGLGLRVTATCTTRTGGHRVELRRHVPPGINPDDLLLDLVVTPPSGSSTDALTDVDVVFQERVGRLPTTVTILPDGDLLTEGQTLTVEPID
jgi:hypothetical protein